MGRDQRFAEMRRGRQMQSQQDLARMMASAGVGGGQPVVPAEPTDRFGVPIRVGDLVLYHANIDPVFEVTDVSPIVHPAAPQGSVQVTLQIRMPVHTSTMGPSQNFIVWGNVKEIAEPAPAAESPSPQNTEIAPDDAPRIALTD